METENQPEHNSEEYDFDIIEMIKVGVTRIEGVKTHFVAAFAIYIIIAIVVQMILGLVFPQGTSEAPHFLNQQIVGILSYPVLMPLMAGIIMMAIDHSRGEEIDFKSMFNYYHLTGKLALAGILIYIMTIVGLLLFILPGIYLTIAYVFTLPLIVDKNMGVWEAMEHSRKTVTKRWFKFFGLMFLLTLALVIGAIPLGIGLIWAIPLMFVTLYGLAYPMLFD